MSVSGPLRALAARRSPRSPLDVTEDEGISQLRSRAAAVFLLLGSLVPLLAIVLPGYLRPGPGPVALIAGMACATLTGTWAVVRWGIPSSLVVPVAAGGDLIVFLTFLTPADRALATVNVSALAVIMFFAAVFGTRRDLLVQTVLANAVVSGGLLVGQRSSAGALMFLLWSDFGLVLPSFAMFSLRARLEAVRRQAQQMARTDPLTGVLNRRGLAEGAPQLLAAAFAAQLPVIALACDLDHFKRINDHYGHAVGDQVLIEAAATLRASVRPQDLVVRLGGEEFAILAALPHAEIAGLADRVRHGVEQTCAAWSQTISIGVAWTDTPTESDTGSVDAERLVWVLIDRADELTFVAKKAGRNRVELLAAV